MSHSFLQTNPKDLARALGEENRAMQEKEAQSQAQSLGVPYLNLQSFPLDLNVLSYFTEQEAVDAESLPFYREVHDLRIATINPGNPLLKQKVKELSEKYKVSLYFVSHGSYRETLKFYKKVLLPQATSENALHVPEDLAKDGVSRLLKQLQDAESLTQASATQILELVCGAAMALGASDIHLEPEQHLLKVRLRVDGVLQDVGHFAPSMAPMVISRIKILAKLKLNITNVPQDGRFTFYFGLQAIDVRVSLLPSGYGESVVMRLLGVGAVNLRLQELGLRGRARDIIEHELTKPNGMIITTGPTGSGKTTTLYAFLNELNKPGVKIITLEDPIEYKLEGIQQTPIDYRVDFSFGKGLRAILRQDPDIIMVGEIRDKETAETAAQAALTGHIVLSTLHTNDAAGAVPRLVTMGVQPFVVAPALNAIIAQRLVRRLCEACRRSAAVTPEMLAKVERVLQAIPSSAALEVPKTLQFFHSSGCQECHNLGYKGRMGIYEVAEVNDAMKALILAGANTLQLRDQAAKDGTISMVQDGLLKALEGITDIEEVLRVAGE
jgi:type II secretory ATPase GspE/PulE/Tfp pilus assembly ATPase PilB-like protein